MNAYEDFLRRCRLHADVANDCVSRMKPFYNSTQAEYLKGLAASLSKTRSPEVVEDALWALELRQEIQKVRNG